VNFEDYRERSVAALEIIRTIGQAIQDAGPEGLPGFELCEVCMAAGMSPEVYNVSLSALKNSKLVQEKLDQKLGHDVLIWVGPLKGDQS